MGWVTAAAKRVYDGRRGQASVVGLALVVAMVILGTVAIVTFGNAAIDGAEDQSRLTRAEHSMTLFDSKAAQVGLGDTQVHTVNFGDDAGNYVVDESAGTISIIQLDYDDNTTNDDGDNDVITTYDGNPGTEDDVYILPPQPLGAVVHETEGAQVAYQGGGVWRKGDDGGVSMISPPEFHYRGLTLTLPIIQTKGSGSVAGTARATIEKSNSEVPVYPHPTKKYDHTGDSFQNPIERGEVLIEIQSEYYKGWGKYFEDRTEGKVNYFPATDTVTVRLISLGNLGDFQMPGDGGHLVVPGASDGHNSKELSIKVRPDDADSANFANLQWSFYAQSGSQQLEIHLKKSGSGTKCTSGSTDIKADLTIYFSDDGGTTYHGWHESEAYEAQCADLNDDGDDEIYFEIDFIDDEDGDTEYDDLETNDPEMTYQSLSSSDLQHFSLSGASLDSSPKFDEHSSVGWEPVDPTTTTMTSDRLLNHYFGLLPNDFYLTVDDKNSDTMNEGVSGGTFNTEGSGKFVTYLHVTRNEVKVTID